MTKQRAKAKQLSREPTAVVYLRVSTKEQANRKGLAEGFSLPTQRQKAQDKARELGAVIVEEFVEAGKSAKTADRAELQRVLAYVEDHPVDYVIVYKVDRLIRNRMDDFVITMALDQAGVQLASCTEHIDNTAAGRFSHGLMALMANWYSDNLSEEIKNKGLAKVQAGGTVGKAPIGYLNVRHVVNGREARSVELDERRAPIVQWAFEAYASGDYSLSALTDAAQQKGLTTVPGPVMVEKPVPRSTLHRMLRNPYYVGYVRRNGVRYEGSHPALVSHEIFDRVQELLEAQNVAGEKQRVHQHYLKGSVYCATCGSRLCITNLAVSRRVRHGHSGVATVVGAPARRAVQAFVAARARDVRETASSCLMAPAPLAGTKVASQANAARSRSKPRARDFAQNHERSSRSRTIRPERVIRAAVCKMR